MLCLELAFGFGVFLFSCHLKTKKGHRVVYVCVRGGNLRGTGGVEQVIRIQYITFFINIDKYRRGGSGGRKFQAYNSQYLSKGFTSFSLVPLS